MGLQDVKRRECQPGQYVRIHGHLRPMDDKYPLVAFSVKQIIDYNEVRVHHCLRSGFNFLFLQIVSFILPLDCRLHVPEFRLGAAGWSFECASLWITYSKYGEAEMSVYAGRFSLFVLHLPARSLHKRSSSSNWWCTRFCSGNYR